MAHLLAGLVAIFAAVALLAADGLLVVVLLRLFVAIPVGHDDLSVV
jgi:hypothetical protein